MYFFYAALTFYIKSASTVHVLYINVSAESCTYFRVPSVGILYIHMKFTDSVAEFNYSLNTSYALRCYQQFRIFYFDLINF
jgi:hypothetical protein